MTQASSPEQISCVPPCAPIFFFNATANTEIYTLSLHDALPIYRATYSGLLKVFFDLLPPDALARKVAIAIATGGGPSHLLAVDHGLRPLLASVGALVVATGIYGTDAQFRAGVPEPAL